MTRWRPVSRILGSTLTLVIIGAVLCGLLTALTVGVLGVGNQALAQDGRTWYVDDDKLDCPDADFSRIRDAMDASSYGDTISVCPGAYHEIDAVIEAGREVIIEPGAVWRVRSLVLLEWAHWIHRGIFYWQAGYSIDLSAEGASISIEGGSGFKTTTPFLIVDEAQTDKDKYSLYEAVQIAGVVLDQNGTGMSANVTAEVTKDGGSVGTVSLVETEAGTYEGAFNATSAAGIYHVAIRAALDGYTGHAAWTGFEVEDSGVLPGQNGTVCIQTDTGTGTACFTPSHGTVEELEALSVPTDPPAGFTFPHGVFSFKVTDLDYDGQTVTVTIELPDPIPAGTKWWKYHNGQWHDYSIPIMISGNTITITLTDAGVGDIDDVAGQITDPGGPGYPVPLAPPFVLPDYVVGWDGSPINKAAVMVPWIALLVAMAGASLLLLRRRRVLS